jgi:hypothetical protein
MNLGGDEWRAQVAAQTAYDHYNSAALLTHYFFASRWPRRQRRPRAYFDAIRRGISPIAAEEKHLLRGRTRADLTAELQKLARRLALELSIE